VTVDNQFPVYAANVASRLAPFVGQKVFIYGKLVDLTNEGFGKELWIGSIQKGAGVR
jgi:hypothetical protein